MNIITKIDCPKCDSEQQFKLTREATKIKVKVPGFKNKKFKDVGRKWICHRCWSIVEEGLLERESEEKASRQRARASQVVFNEGSNESL